MNQTEKYLKYLRDNLSASLKDKFIALYHQDDSSNLSTWILVCPDTDMRLVRQATLLTRQKHASALSNGPAVATPSDIARYQQLFPDIVKKKLEPDCLIAGQNILDFIPPEWKPDPTFQLARVAAEILFCSALVAPDALSPEMKANLTKRLSCLASSLNVAVYDDPLDTLIAVHRFLDGNQTTEHQWHGQTANIESPPHLPNVLSLTGFKNKLIVILPQVDRPKLSAIDWDNIAQLVSEEFDHILLAVPWQLRLAASARLAADLAILSFECVWGADILSDCIPDELNIHTSMALKPLQVLVENLPSGYCTVQESELGNLIHDTQNILHNIQLQNEILARRNNLSPVMPPDPLPGKEIPNHQRMDAIFRHFRWWVENLLPL